MDAKDGGECKDDRLRPSNIFADTSVLLNYVQRDIEPDRTSALVNNDQLNIVVGVTVANELEAVRDRRADIYTDFVDFLLHEDGKIDSYDPASRRPYFQQNDRQHVREIQMQISQLDNRAAIQRQLRRVTRAARRRFEYLHENVIPDSIFDQQPGLMVILALKDAIANDNDRRVVGDAALWAAEGNDSSGILVTMDKADLVEAAVEINTALQDVKDETWELTFVFPTEITAETDSPTMGDPD